MDDDPVVDADGDPVFVSIAENEMSIGFIRKPFHPLIQPVLFGRRTTRVPSGIFAIAFVCAPVLGFAAIQGNPYLAALFILKRGV